MDNIANMDIIVSVFDKYSDMLVAIAERWNEKHSMNILDQDLQDFAATVADEADSLMDEIGEKAFLELMKQIGHYAGKFINLYINRANWDKQPIWLANYVNYAIANYKENL